MPGVRRTLSILVITLIVVLLPLVGSGYLRGLFVLSGIYVVAVTGLALLIGHAGQLSLSQGAFFGLGAYAYSIVATRSGWPPLLALVIAVASVTLVARLVGLLLLRLHSHFFALGTLAFASIVFVLLLELGPWTGGPSGLAGIPQLVPPPSPAVSRDALAGWTAWATAGLSLLAFERMIRSEVGTALGASRSSDVGTAAVGVDTDRLRLTVFVLAATFAAVAGALYASYLSFISPAGFDVLLGVQLMVMVMVGGTASAWGPLLGVVGVMGAVEILRGVIPLVVPGTRGPVELVGLSLILGLTMIFLPRGLAGGGPCRQRPQQIEMRATPSAAGRCVAGKRR